MGYVAGGASDYRGGNPQDVMSFLALVLSLIAVDIAIWPRVSQAWRKFDSAAWAIGGWIWFMVSTGVLLGLLLLHVTINIV